MTDRPSVGTQFFMLAREGHLDHNVCKTVGMMLNAAEKMARHLVEEYDEDDKRPPVTQEKARQCAATFALMHGQIDGLWDAESFEKVEL